jgi:hypothetical protein
MYSGDTQKWESYGSDRCSVLVLTGVFAFLLLFNGVYNVNENKQVGVDNKTRTVCACFNSTVRTLQRGTLLARGFYF